MWTLTLWEEASPALQWGVVFGVSLFAAVTDIRSRRVPNLLTGPVLIAGWVVAAWVGGLAGLADAFAATLLLAFPFVLLFMFANGGAGDAKLMGALGAWLGLAYGSMVLVAVVLSGTVLAMGYAIIKKNQWSVLSNIVHAADHVIHRASVIFVRRSLKGESSLPPSIEHMQTMPYGIAVFVGVCVAAGGALAWHA